MIGKKQLQWEVVYWELCSDSRLRRNYHQTKNRGTDFGTEEKDTAGIRETEDKQRPGLEDPFGSRDRAGSGLYCRMLLLPESFLRRRDSVRYSHARPDGGGFKRADPPEGGGIPAADHHQGRAGDHFRRAGWAAV